jgi:hypothetical protein
MTDHTPGPWVKDYGCTKGHVKAILNDGDYVTPTVARYDIGVVKNPPLFDEETMEANGHLIAAAPEMLAMLEEIASLIHDDGGRVWISASFDPCEIVSLIAHAKGEL